MTHPTIKYTNTSIRYILMLKLQTHCAQTLELLDYVMEGRKRVKDQLYIIDETFGDEPANFHYKIKSSGRAVEVETLERVNYRTEVAQQEGTKAPASPVQPGNAPAPVRSRCQLCSN